MLIADRVSQEERLDQGSTVDTNVINSASGQNIPSLASPRVLPTEPLIDSTMPVGNSGIAGPSIQTNRSDNTSVVGKLWGWLTGGDTATRSLLAASVGEIESRNSSNEQSIPDQATTVLRRSGTRVLASQDIIGMSFIPDRNGVSNLV